MFTVGVATLKQKVNITKVDMESILMMKKKKKLEKSLEKNHTIVVEQDEKLIAFGNIGKTGYLDRLYVHPDYLRKGIASKLVEDLEAYAKKHDCHVINVTSSITSKPFFESKGYTVIEEQINERRGERLLRYLMEKKI